MKLTRLKLYTILLVGGTLYSLVWLCTSTKKQSATIQTAPPVAKVEIPKYRGPANKPLQRTGDIWVWRFVLNLKSRIIRKKVLRELPGMKDKYVYIRLNKKTMLNNKSTGLWSTESWYSMNGIPNSTTN